MGEHKRMRLEPASALTSIPSSSTSTSSSSSSYRGYPAPSSHYAAPPPSSRYPPELVYPAAVPSYPVTYVPDPYSSYSAPGHPPKSSRDYLPATSSASSASYHVYEDPYYR
eukprot:TRINITY_DN9052_c0_g1_i3.p1 TRINITY_DN9052_c0_g1~~TRINITY_DN9052_c0_g1_i3.p1  ORF type:complete len:121 (-),score=33.73 TRINITY_DN9052_c0_g1_i3:254-586(-)